MQKSPHPPSPADGQPEKEFTKRVPKRRAVRGDEATVRRTQARGVAPVAWVPAHEASVGVAIRTHAEALPGGAGHPQACAMAHTAIGVVDARHRRADGVDASRVRTRAARRGCRDTAAAGVATGAAGAKAARHRGRVAVAKVVAPEGAAPTQLARRRRAPTPTVGGLARRHGEVAVVVGALAPAGRTALGRAARGRGGQADATRKVATAARDVGVGVVGACAAVEPAAQRGSARPGRRHAHAARVVVPAPRRVGVGVKGARTPPIAAALGSPASPGGWIALATPEVAAASRDVGVGVVGAVASVEVAALAAPARRRHRIAFAALIKVGAPSRVGKAVVASATPVQVAVLACAATRRHGRAHAAAEIATASGHVGVGVVGACAAVEIARLGGSTSVGARGANTPPEIAPTTRRVGVCVVGPVTAVQVARLRLAARGRHRRALARTEVARTDGLNHGHLKVAGASVAVAWLWGAARHISGIASTSRKVSGTTRNRAEAHELTVAAIDGACLAGAACLIEVQGGRERVSRGHLRWGTVRVKTNRFSRCA